MTQPILVFCKPSEGITKQDISNGVNNLIHYIINSSFEGVHKIEFQQKGQKPLELYAVVNPNIKIEPGTHFEVMLHVLEYDN